MGNENDKRPGSSIMVVDLTISGLTIQGAPHQKVNGKIIVDKRTMDKDTARKLVQEFFQHRMQQIDNWISSDDAATYKASSENQ